MRRHTNCLIYGILLVASAIIIFCLTALSYPLLTIIELLITHPFGSWGIPGILFITGLVLIEIERERRKDE